MNICIIIGTVLVFGIITFLSRPKASKKKTREELLRELADILEGYLSVIKDKEDCYSISFEHENGLFVYEDIKINGFGQESYKSYLRIHSEKKFNLFFAEKKTGGYVKTDIRIASEMGEEDVISQRIFNLPSSLDEFKVVTDNDLLAKKLLEDKQVIKVLTSVKKTSARGIRMIPLRIIDGEITFEFEERENFLKGLSGFGRGIDVLEECVSHLKVVFDALEKCKVEE